MTGHRRLRIPPVGEVRRRWAAILEKEGKVEDDETFGIGELSAAEGEESDNEIWASLDMPTQVTVDPAAGLRLPGSKPRFWDSGPSSPVATTHTSPSTATLANRAMEAGISGSDLQVAVSTLVDPVQRSHAMEDTTPANISQSTSVARKVVSALFRNQSSATGSWRGPLPPRRSPPLTLGDCLFKAGITSEGSAVPSTLSPQARGGRSNSKIEFCS